MKSNLVCHSTFCISIWGADCPTVDRLLRQMLDIAPKDSKRGTPALLFSKRDYAARQEEFCLLPLSVIEIIIASGDVLPDGYDASDDGEPPFHPSYMYGELVQLALEKGLVKQTKQQRTIEETTRTTVTETIYQPLIPLALPYFGTGGDHDA